MVFRRGSPALGSWLLFSLLASRAVAQQGSGVDRDTVPQRDIMDLLGRILHGKPKLKAEVEVPPKMVITVLPSFAANPTVGLSLGISGNAVTRLGSDAGTSLSTVSASVSYTTKKQFNVLLRSNVFAPRNQWKLEGDWRYLDSNQPTFGLGPALPEELEAPMDYQLIRFYETVYRAVARNVLVGVGYHLDHYFEIVDRNASQGSTPYFEYYGSRPDASLASGLSVNVLSDSRDNPITPSNGIYARGSLRMFPTWLGSDDTWQSFEGEFRAYPTVGAAQNVLAFWGLLWFSMGKAPYLNLPAIGWDYNNRTGRGYAQGRIRATNLLYGEAEYRVRLSRDGFWGAVAFLNLTSASDPTTNALKSPNPGGGVGIRIKLNKHSNTNIGIDFAVGAEGSKGVFFGTGEAF
jgi:outer membrane protein assembly factor BamA